MKLSLMFAFERETKNTIRYQEVDTSGKPAFAPKLTTIYIQKSALPGGRIPQTLTVTVEEPTP